MEPPQEMEKTDKMRWVEERTHTSIETLVEQGSLSDVVRHLSHYGINMDRATISKWRKKVREARSQGEQ